MENEPESALRERQEVGWAGLDSRGPAGMGPWGAEGARLELVTALRRA